MSQRPLLLLKTSTPLGDSFEIPYHDLGPRSHKPELALVAGTHGNELNGIFALSRLAGFLKTASLKKRVIIIPAVNVLGLHTLSRLWPFDRTDINRMFPGYHAGETTQRLADAVYQKTKPARIRIDIHSSNLEFEEMPQVRIYRSSEAERATARQMGLSPIVECPLNKTSMSTLLHAWQHAGGQNFVLQAGVAGSLQMPHANRIYQALVNLMVRTGIITGAALLKEDDVETGVDVESIQYFPLGHTVSLVSEKAGLFVPRIQLGRTVEAGAILGHVYDGFDGRVRSRVRAPVSGLLTGLRYQALLYQGDLLARVQASRPVAKGADTHLIGQGQ